MNFGAKFAQKRVFPVENGKTEQDHCIPHIRIYLGTKLQFKPTMLIFCTKFAQKGCSQSNTEKVNPTIEFCIFEYFTLSKQF